MSSTFVLLICAVLAFLLLGSRKWVSLALIISFLPFITLDPQQTGMEDLSDFASSGSTFKMGTRALGAAMFLVLGLRDRRFLGSLARPGILIAIGFVLWAALGTVNSANPSLSLVRLGEFAAMLLGGLVLHHLIGLREGPMVLLRHVVYAILPLVLCVAWYSLTKSAMAFEYASEISLARLGGRMIDPNTLGYMAGIMGVAGITFLRMAGVRRRRWDRVEGLAFLLGALVLLVMVQSRTSTLGFAASLLFLGFTATRRNAARRFFLLAGCFALLVLAISWSDPLYLWFSRGESLATVRSATGRTYLWSALLTRGFPVHPVLGCGYLMLSDTGRFLLDGVPWNNAHNAFLFALVSTGLVGFLLIVGMVFLTLRRMVARARRLHSLPEDRIAHQGLAACLAATLFEAFSGYGMVGYPSPSMFVFLILFATSVWGWRR